MFSISAAAGRTARRSSSDVPCGRPVTSLHWRRFPRLNDQAMQLDHRLDGPGSAVELFVEIDFFPTVFHIEAFSNLLHIAPRPVPFTHISTPSSWSCTGYYKLRLIFALHSPILASMGDMKLPSHMKRSKDRSEIALPLRSSSRHRSSPLSAWGGTKTSAKLLRV